MGATKRPKIEDFRKVSAAKGGMMASIAQVFGVERQTIYNWCEKYPEYRKAIDNSREVFVDIAETNLQTIVKGIPLLEEEDGKKVFKGWIKEPSESAIIFVLRTLGKKRGYTEKQELEIDGKGSISIDKWIEKSSQ